MARSVSFTQAQVRRAVKAAESAGVRVRRITVGRDGSITVDDGESATIPVDSHDKALAASWDDL